MNPLDFYASQSAFSNPGSFTYQLDGLPRDVAALCQIVQGVYLHYTTGETYGYSIPKERLNEIDLRYTERMLAHIFELDARPIDKPRPVERKLVSYCGSAATLLCALARFRGIPARKRVGFARYFVGYGPSNHEVAELWDAEQAHWKLVDPHLDEVIVKQNQISFDIHNVPRDSFMVGGQAWQMCRAGNADPNDFGIGDFKGFWMVRNCLIKDLAALNKIELLDWDNWGWGLKDFNTHTEEELTLLDRVASVTQSGNKGFPALQRIYKDNPGFRIPKVIMSFSPVAGPVEISLVF